MIRFRKLNERGVALIVTYFILASLFILVAATTQGAVSELNQAKRNMSSTEGLYLAEAGVEQAAYELGFYVANNYMDPPDGAISGTISLSPDFSSIYSCNVYDDQENTLTDNYGIVTYVKSFTINATANHNQYDVAVDLNQIVARKKTYTFQHAVFYTDDLEILPGPNMTLSGRVHSNSDIYLGTHNTLSIDTAYLYSAGDIYNMRKDSDDEMEGDVRIRINDSPDYALMLEEDDDAPLDSRRDDWTDESQNRWNGTVKSSVHGITTLAVPSVGSIAPDGYYANQANIKVVNGAIIQDGDTLIQGVDIPLGTIQTTTTFYNNREGKWVKMTNIDLRKLAGYDEDDEGEPSFQNHLPTNGLIYATRNDVPGFQQAGIRLVNGTKIERDGGLTLVSNAPVYIKGDYNTLDKRPASVICDAVNILSNAWQDNWSRQGVGSRQPTNTQINSAFIAGVDTTVPEDYNGGLENYPRLHENWSKPPQRTLSIRGSFVELWNSQIAQGQWQYGNPQYTAPVRDWDYDTDFNNADNLPPFTPFAVEVERVVWWK